MGRYRKVDTRIWNDEKFCSLTQTGKLIFLFLLTHPHMTSLGAMRATVDGMAAELGIPSGSLREGLREAFQKGMVDLDERASFVCLPNFLKYNGPESPNVVKAWDKCIDLIPECHKKALLLTRVATFCESLSVGFREALPIPFRKGMPYPEPEPEQEQEQEPEQEKNTHTAPVKSRAGPFKPPTIEQVTAYCLSRSNRVNPESFVDFYTSKGWKVGAQSMKDWQAAVRTWEKNDGGKTVNGSRNGHTPQGAGRYIDPTQDAAIQRVYDRANAAEGAS